MSNIGSISIRTPTGGTTAPIAIYDGIKDNIPNFNGPLMSEQITAILMGIYDNVNDVSRDTYHKHTFFIFKDLLKQLRTRHGNCLRIFLRRPRTSVAANGNDWTSGRESVFLRLLEKLCTHGEILVNSWPEKEKAPAWYKEKGVGVAMWTVARDIRDLILTLARGEVAVDSPKDYWRGKRMGGAHDHDPEGFEYFGP
ncbi:hypothetical protein EG328_009469 [Venturia inaequalis]|uniref:Uncharacterized protein n=1 Tax=Venturia inaequalis TaxID=5025 RepID=A0A8H3VCH1_VENIN|nr:hypothetical protein EG328_009469 [Venturia inaequalis]KAE9985410.1 hypothetical protein EG327_004703 [Venturia inaequalis]